MLLARGLPDTLGLSSSSPSLSVSDNWASSSLELWELPHFSSDSDCSSLLLSSARQLLVLRRVLDKRITWSFSHSFLNRWTGPEIKTKIIDTLLPEARWYALYKNINSTRYSYETYSYKKKSVLNGKKAFAKDEEHEEVRQKFTWNHPLLVLFTDSVAYAKIEVAKRWRTYLTIIPWARAGYEMIMDLIIQLHFVKYK